MPRWLLWSIPVILLLGAVGVAVAVRAQREPPEDAESQITEEEPTAEEPTPSRVETEDQMRAIGYVQ